MTSLGIVIIGRNEGERLIRCIQSLQEYHARTVYVDSASTDCSVEVAKKLGVHIVNLDMSKPFTAARARNTGFDVLMSRYPETTFVQFVDGDCEVMDSWLEVAVAFLKAHPEVAVVNGILDERFPDKTIYNTLCDLEWKMQAGEVKACGGNALMRVSSFQDAKGFLPELIAGEEPELCVRLRTKGWKIWHLNQAMIVILRIAYIIRSYTRLLQRHNRRECYVSTTVKILSYWHHATSSPDLNARFSSLSCVILRIAYIIRSYTKHPNAIGCQVAIICYEKK